MSNRDRKVLEKILDEINYTSIPELRRILESL